MRASLSKQKLKRLVPPAVSLLKKQRPAKPQASRGGVVLFCVQGTSGSQDSKGFTPAQLVQMLQVGLPFAELEDLQSSLAIPSERLAPMLGISKATFHRRKGRAGRLPLGVSDKVVRYARLLGQALKVFNGPDAAKLWLNSPQAGLAGAVPLDYARTELGAREVENLLGRIEYGVYS